jgi:peptide/nickel transport system permease protein
VGLRESVTAGCAREPAQIARQGQAAKIMIDSRVRAIARHLLAACGTLFLISVVTFVATSSSPQNIARNVLGHYVTASQLDAYIAEHGLDRPIVVRYSEWISGLVRGDWGRSEVTGREVWPEIVKRAKRTVVLSLLSILVAVPSALMLGVFMARRAGSYSDLSLLIVTVIFAALPEFIIGIGLIALFSVTLEWLPANSTGMAFGTFRDVALAYVLPTSTLALAIIPYIARIARSTAVEAFSSAYTRAAVLRGLPRRSVVWSHAMRNAAVPLVNAIAINLVYLLGGVVVVENVFAFPGLGQQLVAAIGQSDTIVVMAITMVLGVLFIGISFTADLLVVYFNPRLQKNN